MPNNKNILREKINEACPELMFTSVCRVSEENPKGVRKNWKKPHLEHLLRTVEKSDEQKFLYRLTPIFLNYDLTKSPLEQSEEVISSLLKIIK